jgi:hypothetical protein
MSYGAWRALFFLVTSALLRPAGRAPPRGQEQSDQIVLVGAGDGPCVVVAVGARRPDDGTLYVASELAARYGASVAADTPDPDVAYADAPPFKDGPAPSVLGPTAAG